MAALDPIRRAVNRDPGALAHAVSLLRWWAEDVSDEPDVVEKVKQSKEVARALVRLARAANPREAQRPVRAGTSRHTSSGQSER